MSTGWHSRDVVQFPADYPKGLNLSLNPALKAWQKVRLLPGGSISLH